MKHELDGWPKTDANLILIIEIILMTLFLTMNSADRALQLQGSEHYLDHGNCIGWTRAGAEEMEKSGCAVLLSNGDAGFKKMEIGKGHKGKIFIDYLAKITAEIKIDDEGFGTFQCLPGSVSVWIEK